MLVLLGRRNPDRWQLSSDPISSFIDTRLPGGLAGYAHRISLRRPALIAVGRAATDEWLQPVLARQYTRVGAGDSWTWWAQQRPRPRHSPPAEGGRPHRSGGGSAAEPHRTGPGLNTASPTGQSASS